MFNRSEPASHNWRFNLNDFEAATGFMEDRFDGLDPEYHRLQVKFKDLEVFIPEVFNLDLDGNDVRRFADYLVSSNEHSLGSRPDAEILQWMALRRGSQVYRSDPTHDNLVNLTKEIASFSENCESTRLAQRTSLAMQRRVEFARLKPADPSI